MMTASNRRRASSLRNILSMREVEETCTCNIFTPLEQYRILKQQCISLLNLNLFDLVRYFKEAKPNFFTKNNQVAREELMGQSFNHVFVQDNQNLLEYWNLPNESEDGEQINSIINNFEKQIPLIKLKAATAYF
jgi:hypothetical protein